MSINDEHIELLADTFKVLGDKTRLRILTAVMNGRICVGDIAKVCDIPQPLASHHLRLLKAYRLVVSTRENKQIFYEAADNHIKGMVRDMMAHIQEEDE